MWLYLIIFFIPVLFYYNGSAIRQKQTIFLACFLFFLAVFVGISDMLGGYDRYIYGEVFDTIADITTRKGNYITSGSFLFFNGEYGYSLLNILISFITENRYIFILAITIIIYLCLFLSLKKYAENYPFALILFLGLWFFFSFTYLRQVLGATIVWLSIQYIIDRKLWKFLAVMFIGFSMHNSAIIFLPMYFIPIKKYSPKTIIGIALILVVIGASPLPNILFQFYGDAAVIERNNEYNASGGLRIAYILESFLFLYFIIRYYKTISETKQNLVLLNMAIMFCFILIFFIRSENGGRLSWYYIFGIITTLTHICCQKKRSHHHLPIIFMGVCLFLFIRVYNGWQFYLNLYPYKTFLTDGFRKGDYSWERYEYDHNYDHNKFYRALFRLNFNFNGLKNNGD